MHLLFRGVLSSLVPNSKTQPEMETAPTVAFVVSTVFSFGLLVPDKGGLSQRIEWLAKVGQSP